MSELRSRKTFLANLGFVLPLVVSGIFVALMLVQTARAIPLEITTYRRVTVHMGGPVAHVAPPPAPRPRM